MAYDYNHDGVFDVRDVVRLKKVLALLAKPELNYT